MKTPRRNAAEVILRNRREPPPKRLSVWSVLPNAPQSWIRVPSVSNDSSANYELQSHSSGLSRALVGTNKAASHEEEPKSSSRPARSFVSWRCVTTHPPGLSCAISCIALCCKLPRRWREKSQRETRETRRHMTRITQSRSQARLHAKSVSSSVHCFRDRRASTGRHKHMREKPPPHA